MYNKGSSLPDTPHLFPPNIPEKNRLTAVQLASNSC